MSRKIKNIIMIVIILIVCVLSYFTMKGAAQSSMPNKASFKNNFEGKITKIDSIGSYSASGTTYPVEVSLENDGEIFLGMTAKVTI